MATSFPASLDTLTNPTSSDSLSSPSHSAQHANVNDAVEALQAKVGADSSGGASSHDYKIADHASRLTTLEAISHGKILQVVQSVKTNGFSANTAAWHDVPDLSLSITPTTASSKVMVFVFASATNSLTNQYTGFNLIRDATAIAQGTGGSVRNQTFHDANGSSSSRTVAFSFLDSPATTSATTYKVQIWPTAGTSTVGSYSPSYSSICTITAMEVSA